MIMLFSMEGKFDSVIQGQATTAAVDLDTNTAGGTTKETHVSHTHTHSCRRKTSRMSTCCH